jgi:predicted permease
MSLRRVIARLIGPRRRAEIDADLSIEIAEHLRIAAEEKEAQGYDPVAARDAALREFGNPTLAREDSRDEWGWPGLNVSDVSRSTLRSIRRNPGFSGAVVLTLAIAIGANTAMFSVIDGVLLKPLPYRDPQRLVSLHLRSTGLKDLGVQPLPALVFNLWRDHATLLENIAVIRPGSANFTGVGGPEQVLGARVSSSLFATLGISPALGRPFAAAENRYQGPRLAILSDGFWRRRFGGDPTIIGRAIHLDGAAFSVVGVMSPGFELPIDLQSEHAAHFDVLLPLDITPDEVTNHFLWGVARLKPGVTMAQARGELDASLTSVKGGEPEKSVVRVLKTNLTERVQGGLGLLMAAVGLVLLIACGNLANMLLSRGLSRRKEIAVRAALGASRWQIVRQLLAENVGLSLLGGLVGVLWAGWFLRLMLARIPEELPHRDVISIDARALTFCLVLTISCAMLFAIVPAWRFSRTDPQDALRQTQRGASDSRRSDGLRRSLIGLQVALCTMLLIGAGLLLRSFARVLGVDRGFATENVVVAGVPLDGSQYDEPARRNSTYRAIEERLAGMPGISMAGAVSWLPLSGDEWQNPIFLPNAAVQQSRDRPMAQIRIATANYFSAAGVPLRSGRVYSDDAGDKWSAVVSENAARRLWPGRDPIGQEFTIDGSAHPRIWRVAGVVADVRQTGLHSPAPLIVYLPTAHNVGMDLSFVVRTNLPLDVVAPAIRQAVHSVDPNVPVTAIRGMSELVAASTAQRRFQVFVLTTFASIAVLLAALGIYGTVSYAVNQRYREIGIRLALGARRREVGALILRQALSPVVLGLIAGSGSAVVLMRALSSLLYGVGAGDAPTYSVSGAVVMIVALAACSLPTLRAMRLDPLETIRSD